MKNEKSAGAVIYCLDEFPRFLLLKNTLKTTYWEFPKGHTEENENIEETATREAQEETGLKNLQVIPGFSHTITWFFKFKGELIHKEAVYILIKIPKEDMNKAKISEEHQEFKWLSYEEAMQLMKIKSNKELLTKANDFILEFEKQKTLF